eukprot:CAMPEP_0176084152 /NCGR_PEP_ID=MMETSP0120_2-20121206/42109_1 /TAXON_ID=160619 /ORGANISM="Kryptoperidinium foliaceum, Strain CCMP 1326" /LENGTH=154 /DNA_ID=CAMNT_0017417951 /DNA_START=562 /DNA_END=1024 /DNA_ORIENTATION=+
MRASAAQLTLSLQLPVGAALARPAVPLDPAVRARVALRAIPPLLPMLQGVHLEQLCFNFLCSQWRFTWLTALVSSAAGGMGKAWPPSTLARFEEGATAECETSANPPQPSAQASMKLSASWIAVHSRAPRQACSSNPRAETASSAARMASSSLA